MNNNSFVVIFVFLFIRVPLLASGSGQMVGSNPIKHLQPHRLIHSLIALSP